MFFTSFLQFSLHLKIFQVLLLLRQVYRVIEIGNAKSDDFWHSHIKHFAQVLLTLDSIFMNKIVLFESNIIFNKDHPI